MVLGAIWQHAGEEHLLRRGGLLQGGPRQAQRTLLLTRTTRGGALLHPSGSLVRDADAGLGGTLVWWWWRNVQSMPSDIILSDLYYKVGSFLEDMGKYDGALGIYLEARFLYDKASQPIHVARAECAVAHIYHLKGAYKQAQQLFKDALERFKKEKGIYIYISPNQSGATKVANLSACSFHNLLPDHHIPWRCCWSGPVGRSKRERWSMPWSRGRARRLFTLPQKMGAMSWWPSCSRKALVP